LAAGVIEAAVTALDTDTSQLQVSIGPAISGDRYQVGPEVIAASPYFVPHARADVGDRSMLDTRDAALSILEVLGVPRENVSISTQVTDGGTQFFSDRAARPCGRFALVAKWQS
jgi:copper oxidase (laccase) domain-containing protein